MLDIKISFSKLQTLSNCQYEYKYRYIDKEKSFGNIYTEIGTLMHTCIEMFLNSSKSKKETIDYFLSMYRDITSKSYFYDINIQKNIDKNKDSVEKHEKYYINYLRNLKRFKNDIEIETYVKLPLSNISNSDKVDNMYFIGYVDLIVKEKDTTRVVDFKTSTEYSGEKKKIHQNQLILYGIALESLGYKNIKLYWDFLKYEKNKGSKTLFYREDKNFTYNGLKEIPFNDETKNQAILWLLKGIENILKLEISNKYNDIFSPDNFYCKNLCSFYTQCLDRYGVYD